MANTPRQLTDEDRYPATPDRANRYAKQQKDRAIAEERTDEALFKQATQGVPDEETRDKILALGGDVTRASPVMSQILGDPTPGLTTTTGAHRTPIDPTTAAVPAEPESNQVMRMKGYPTVGSGRQGGGREQLFKKPDRPDMPTE
jgi:hypothetical protein